MIICNFEIAKFKLCSNTKVNLRLWKCFNILTAEKMHITSIYTYTHKCTHIHTHAAPMYTCSQRNTHAHTNTWGCVCISCTHTSSSFDSVSLLSLCTYQQQNNFWTNCVLSLLSALCISVLIRIKDKALSPAIQGLV